jgi:hypothetical protein
VHRFGAAPNTERTQAMRRRAGCAEPFAETLKDVEPESRGLHTHQHGYIC